MLGQRFFQFTDRVELEIGDGEIWRLPARGVGDALIEFATHQSFRLQPRDDKLVVIVEIVLIVKASPAFAG
jgi:hypothetical protein